MNRRALTVDVPLLIAALNAIRDPQERAALIHDTRWITYSAWARKKAGIA